MGLPSKRRTSQSKRERAAHFALKPAQLTSCSKCGKMIIPHHVCPHCGYYRGRDVLHLGVRSERKRLKEKKREAKVKNG